LFKKRTKMKFNTLFVAVVCAGTLLSSCVHKTAQERQLKYTHTSLVDGDAFAIIQKVGETILTGTTLAENAEASGDAQSKEVASKVKAFYTQLTPSLDSVATAFHVDFPIKGIPAVEETKEQADTTEFVLEQEAQAHGQEHHVDYVHQAQHELAVIKEQLTRLARNTNKDLQNFAKNVLPSVSELYTQIGGKEDAHAHHH